MKKRAVERIDKNINVTFISAGTEYSGIMMNFSQKGMFICTDVNVPIRNQIKIHIPVRKEVLKVLAEVKSFTNSGDVQNGIGVELINPPQDYLIFIDSLKSGF